MILAPGSETGELPERRFDPAPPDGRSLQVWGDAAGWAVRCWRELADSEGLHREVRAYARYAAEKVRLLAERVSPPVSRG